MVGARNARFTALQSLNEVRSLTTETNRMGAAALLDPLTGLGNRHMMTSEVDRAGEDLAAVFIDVDEFKQVNDRYSHAVGDEVLRRIATILRSHSRADDVPVRYGGDEFVILVNGGAAAAKEVAERVHDAVSAAPWEQVAPRLRVTVSVGVGRPVPGPRRDRRRGRRAVRGQARRSGPRRDGLTLEDRWAPRRVRGRHAFARSAQRWCRARPTVRLPSGGREP